MKVNKSQLLNALEKVKPGLSSKEIIEQTTNFAFMNGRVVTYNDEISISCKVDGIDFEGAVEAAPLYKFLNKIKHEDIELEIQETSLVVKGGNAEAGLAFKSEVKLPVLEITKEMKWVKLPSDFISALALCRFSCSRDMSKPVLTCVHINNGVVETCDNHRLTTYDLQRSAGKTPMLLPATSVTELIKYQITHYTIHGDRSWIIFKTDDDSIHFGCRVYQEEYPDLSPIREFGGNEILLPEGLSEVLDRAVIFAVQEDDHFPEVDLTVFKNKIQVSVEKNTSWFKESLDTKYDGEELKLSVNPLFLKEILGKIKSCVINEDLSKMKFVGDVWNHVIALK